MRQLSFSKYHGAGNDFVFLDGGAVAELGLSKSDLQQLAMRLCDRHFGIGADGLIVVEREAGVDARMLYFNVDGLETMCGNGTRCAARYLFDNAWIDRQQTSLRLQTFKGELAVSVFDAGQRFEVNMGAPVFEGSQIPVAASGEFLEHRLEVGGESIEISAVNMGNPHCVMFLSRSEIDRLWPLAPQIEHHPFYPQRTNVEFVEIVDRQNVIVKVWERGCGETLACGTGNCAVLAAGVRRGYLEPSIKLKAAGGDFLVRWDEQTNNIFLQGPAEFVFSGTIAI